MSQTVADYLLARLREWGVEQVFGYPGDGINGLLAAWGRADDEPQFVQARHEEMAAFEAVGFAKFTGKVGVCAATSGPGAIHLLNGLYDAKLDHVPVVAIVGPDRALARWAAPTSRRSTCITLFKDVCSDYVQMCTVPEQLPNLIDRAIRIALSEQRPTCLIFPSDVLELSTSRPGTHSRRCPPAWASAPAAGRTPTTRRVQAAADLLNAGEQGRHAGRAGRPRLRGGAHRGRRPARAPARPRRCSARTCCPTTCRG